MKAFGTLTRKESYEISPPKLNVWDNKLFKDKWSDREEFFWHLPYIMHNYKNNHGNLYHYDGDYVVINVYSDEETNALTRLKEYFNAVESYRRRLQAHREPKSALAKMFKRLNKKPFPEGKPARPTDILVVEVIPDHLKHYTEDDIDLIRVAHHQGTLKTPTFRNNFIKMMDERVQNNIENFFAQRGNPWFLELTKKPKRSGRNQLSSNEDLQEKQNWEKKLIALEKEAIQKS